MTAKANGLKFEEEQVVFVRDDSHVERLIPTISVGSGLSKRRNFEPGDMARVLDYDGIKEATPKDCQLLYCENGEDGPQFVSYHICIRGGYIFYFDPNDVDDKTGNYTTYESIPIGVIPLDDVRVQFPPGGRRAFREHAHTDARNGYELAILHNPPQPLDEDKKGSESDRPAELRPPFFLVSESMGQRKEWEKAIKVRGGLKRPTLLRAGYTSAALTSTVVSSNDGAKDNGATLSQQPESAKMSKSTDAAKSVENLGPRNDEMLMIAKQEKSNKVVKGFSTTGRRNRESKSTEMQIMEVADDAELASAVVEFGAPDFNEKDWVDQYFQARSDFEATEKCSLMEQWQTDMKNSLKGAVLQQYEYFVQASGQMTEMGREVSSLKSRIETQVDTLKEMKEIDFLGILYEDQEEDAFQNEQFFGGLDDDDDSEGDLELKILKSRGAQSLFGESSTINPARIGENKLNKDYDGSEDQSPRIDVPSWVKNVDEEISELVRECRYNDAIELHVKSKNEVEDLLERHDDPGPYRISKKQLEDVRSLKRSLKTLGDRISRRMVESLRRKNEALRQASKRERADPNSALAPVISPTALNDDSIYLRLLVKLGRTSEATEAYSHRRSLLLLETLQERPIAGAGTVDLVIYAAQLSQSFFSCLANSIEGFLDLFVLVSPKDDKSEEESVASSLHSQSLGGAPKQLPAGAMASLVLWCDSELSKFASAFGGTRVLANLALSPPGRDGPKGPRVVGGSSIDDGSKERRNAIEVAAQCIDQAFLHASENLDSVGLPLTPRLSAMVRARLKGCEKEVSALLDERWQSLTKDWRFEDIPNDGRTPIRST